MRAVLLVLAMVLATAAGAATFDSHRRPTSVSGFPDLEIQTDVAYGRGGNHPLLLDLFRPHAAGARRLPIVVVIHGGGWVNRDKAYTSVYEAPTLARAGFLCASIDYRPSSEAPFPAALEDCKCAVRWLRANGARFGGDPDHIGAFGMSAGGHLALMLACVKPADGMEGQGGNDDVSSAVQAACSWYGPTDLAPAITQPGYFTPQVTANVRRFLGNPSLERAEYASPISYVAARWAPVLLVQGVLDPVVPVDQAQRLFDALRLTPNDVSLVRVEHGVHAFDPVGARVTQPPLSEIRRATSAFLLRHLRPGAVASLR